MSSFDKWLAIGREIDERLTASAEATAEAWRELAVHLDVDLWLDTELDIREVRKLPEIEGKP